MTTPTPKLQNKRKSPPTRRKKNERRKDMQIVVSASQSDIYLWAGSIALMVGVLTAFVACALLLGGQ